MTRKTEPKPEVDIEVDNDEEVDISDALSRKIVVFNDDVNSFLHVIKTLCEVLNHTSAQAEQCASIIHHTGKCVVKEGSYDYLKPRAEAICERGIDARIL